MIDRLDYLLAQLGIHNFSSGLALGSAEHTCMEIVFSSTHRSGEEIERVGWRSLSGTRARCRRELDECTNGSRPSGAAAAAGWRRCGDVAAAEDGDQKLLCRSDNSDTGNRTPGYRVRGDNVSHYTISDT